METSDPKYKHKPSEKHTLEEVLKSLQDLIRNDLAEGASGTVKPGSVPAASRPRDGMTPDATETKPRRDITSSLREDFAPVAPGSGPVNLDAVMRSLKDLIGNELNVGDAPPPAPAETAPASTHEEYLATEEKIEEYIPEELGRLDEELIVGDEPVAEQPAPAAPPDESAAAPEITAENMPQEFAPLDEELTFEVPAQTPPSAPPVSATTELPGEISSELLAEPVAETEPAPVSSSESPRAPDTNLARGTQQELFLEEPPPIELRMPPPPAPETAPAPELATEPEASTAAPEPAAETVLEIPAAPTPEALPSEPGAGETMQALPIIEVEESFDTGNYFDGTALSAEDSPSSLEEIVIQDVESPGAPETAAPAMETTPATPADASPAPEPPATPVEKKITLEIVNGPLLDNPQTRSEADSDSLGREPSPPEPTPSPVAAEALAPETELPVIVIEPDLSPAPEPETPKAPEKAPATEIKAGEAPAVEPPPAPAESATPDTPVSFNIDDIPVLNEVVAPPAGSVPTPAAPPAPPLPAPDRARDLVVRAVAKLNVEMRKTGGTGLDTKTILRLQQLIRQELEKNGGK